MTKQTYESNENYECILELEGGHTFLHLEVHNYSPTIRKELKEHLEVILGQAKSRGEEFLFFYYEKPSVFKLANILKTTASHLWAGL